MMKCHHLQLPRFFTETIEYKLTLFKDVKTAVSGGVLITSDPVDVPAVISHYSQSVPIRSSSGKYPWSGRGQRSHFQPYC